MWKVEMQDEEMKDYVKDKLMTRYEIRDQFEELGLIGITLCDKAGDVFEFTSPSMKFHFKMEKLQYSDEKGYFK